MRLPESEIKKIGRGPQDLALKLKTIKLLEENIDSKLFNISLSNIFFCMFPQARETEAKIKQMDYIKLKCFYTTKETINKTKSSLLNGRIYLQMIYPMKGLYSKHIKNL